jgi:hypothetical protein
MVEECRGQTNLGGSEDLNLLSPERGGPGWDGGVEFKGLGVFKLGSLPQGNDGILYSIHVLSYCISNEGSRK